MIRNGVGVFVGWDSTQNKDMYFSQAKVQLGIGFGNDDAQNPYWLIGFYDDEEGEPYQFIGFYDDEEGEPYQFIGFGDDDAQIP